VLADPYTTRRPSLLAFPVIGAVAAKVVARSVRHRRSGPRFTTATLVFAALRGTLAGWFRDHIIPLSVTMGHAAMPHSGLVARALSGPPGRRRQFRLIERLSLRRSRSINLVFCSGLSPPPHNVVLVERRPVRAPAVSFLSNFVV
jgi:hypothetical protein